MKPIWSILLITNLFGQEPLISTQPKAKIPFELTYYDIRERIHINYVGGKIDVEFTIDENGNVINPVILDTFDIFLNDVVLDKVKQSKYYPATQNGRPIKVKYKLPIVFK
tara:strand:- start:130 stop:459 length:330 start_codon:yes stop_codon:yes gene_type:complete